MPVTTASLPAVQTLQASFSDRVTGQVTPEAYRFFLDLIGSMSILLTAVNQAVGVNSFTLAGQPSLGAGDAGFLGFVTDYGHWVRWTGAIWQFAAGDVGNKFFRDYVGAPQEAGWQLCDGTVTDYLVVGGAALSATPFTTPNLSGSPAYRKSGAAYAGIAAASGATDTATGTTAGPNAHITLREKDPADFTESSPSDTHTHDFTIPALGVGTIDMAHLTVLPYFRR